MRNDPEKITIRLTLDRDDPFDAVIVAWLDRAGGPARKVIRHALYNAAAGGAVMPLAQREPPVNSPARNVIKDDEKHGEGGDDVPGLDEIIGRF